MCPKLKVKPREDVVAKWVEEAPRRAPYYEKYTPPAADDWESKAADAAPVYKAAVTAPDIDVRFKGGIKRVGAAKFKRKVLSVGVARFGPGITAAKEDYDVGVAPFLEELAVIDVPERKPRGDPANIKRVEAIFTALHKKRLAMLAALIRS